MFNSSGNYSLNWGYIVMNFQDFVNYCCAHNILKHKWHLAYVWWYRNVILMALTKEIHCIYHVTKGFPGGLLTLDWPSYTSPSDVTPHAPILGISSIPYTWKGCLYIEPGALGLTWCWLTQLTMDTVYFSWFKTHRCQIVLKWRLQHTWPA